MAQTPLGPLGPPIQRGPEEPVRPRVKAKAMVGCNILCGRMLYNPHLQLPKNNCSGILWQQVLVRLRGDGRGTKPP